MPREYSWAVVPLRVIVGGAVFVSEGLQKWLYADDLGSGRFAGIGIPAPEVMGPLVGGVEILCGLLLLLGWKTRYAAVPLIGVMLVALLTTKLPILLGTEVFGFAPRSLPRYGLLSALHESRTDLLALAALVLLVVHGPGRPSLDGHGAGAGAA